MVINNYGQWMMEWCLRPYCYILHEKWVQKEKYGRKLSGGGEGLFFGIKLPHR